MSTTGIAIIYLLTNTVNGKRYIGFTTNLKQRLNSHRSRAGKRDYHLSRAIAKYGWEAFTCEVICSSKDAEYLKDVMEAYFINTLDTLSEHGRGYNMTEGGEGTLGYKRTPTQCRRLSEKMKGRKLSAEQCRLISEHTRGENNPNYGKVASPEKRAKISDGIKRALAEGRGKRVWTEEQKRVMSVRVREWAKRPENIARLVARNKAQTGKPGHPHTEEHKRYMSLIMTGREIGASTRRALQFANMEYVWIISGPEGKTYKVGCLEPFCRHFNVKRDTINRTLDPTWVPYRKRRCLWTGLSKRPITEEEREYFRSTDQLWEEIAHEPVDSTALRTEIPSAQPETERDAD